MIEKLIDIIKHDSESARVDFKLQEYPLGKDAAKKNELLKDICAMTNHPSDDPKYILIGVKEKNGMVAKVVGIESPTDQAQYQQFIDSNLEPRINFEYLVFEYEGCTLSAFVIKGNQQRPYLFKREVKRPTDKKVEYRVGDGFIRSGTSTRKLSRKDMEDIYARRQQAKDRKSDLKITPIGEKLGVLNPYATYSLIIDFEIENLSSKSLGFDPELRLFKRKGVNVISAMLFLDRINERQGWSLPGKSNETIEHIDIEGDDGYWKVTKLAKANDTYTVKLAQKDTEKRVFNTDMLVTIKDVATYGTIVEAELILRSDEFKDGPIVKKYSFDALVL